MPTDYDAIVVGSGPNGLSAAIVLQQAGLSVLLMEAANEIGGGLRSAELTLPGFIHDCCSAIHPMAAMSPFFSSLPLAEFGLGFIDPPAALAHPLPDGGAAMLYPSLEKTAAGFGVDENSYRRLMAPVVRDWPDIGPDVLAPIHFPKHPFAMAGFGLKALATANAISRRFKNENTKSFWGGLALHSQLPFDFQSTAAIGITLLTCGHMRGWPYVRGGSQQLANALVGLFVALGGKIQTGSVVSSLDALPSAKALLLDIGPAQLLKLSGNRYTPSYRKKLQGFRLGMGVFKMDWALDAPIPFRSPLVKDSATVHIGGSYAEMAAGESDAWNGRHCETPGLIMAQQSLFDSSRAPAGKHTAWGYCHVPNGSTKDMSAVIEKQIERFAPGFRERILARSVINTEQLEESNANYIGGDIGGGANLLSQLFTRPVLQRTPYRTGAKGIYLCSASTPPGGGVHGMCGFHAAHQALKDMFDR